MASYNEGLSQSYFSEIIDGIQILPSGCILTTSGTAGTNLLSPGTGSYLRIYTVFCSTKATNADVKLQWSGTSPVVISNNYLLQSGGMYSLIPGARPGYIQGEAGIPLQGVLNATGSVALNIGYNIVR